MKVSLGKVQRTPTAESGESRRGRELVGMGLQKRKTRERMKDSIFEDSRYPCNSTDDPRIWEKWGGSYADGTLTDNHMQGLLLTPKIYIFGFREGILLVGGRILGPFSARH